VWDGRTEAGKWSHLVDPLRRVNPLSFLNAVLVMVFGVRLVKEESWSTIVSVVVVVGLFGLCLVAIWRRRRVVG